MKYTKEHEWVSEVSTNRYRVGITDYAQVALGDIVYIQLPKVGDEIGAGKVCGEVESTKSVSEIYAPLTGTLSFFARRNTSLIKGSVISPLL